MVGEGLFKRIFKFQETPSKITKIIVQQNPIGISGTDLNGGIIDEDYLSVMTGTERSEIFDKMRRQDARVKMNLSAIKNPLRSADWSWEAQGHNKETDFHAKFLNHIFNNDLNKTFSQVLNDAVSCVDFGFAVLERTHKVVENHAEFGTYNSLASIGARLQKTIEEWIVDNSGCLIGVKQQVFSGDLARDVILDPRFLTIISLDKEGDNYEGISLLRPCYGSWLRKQVFLKLNSIGVEKHAIPTPVATIPAGMEGGDKADALESALLAYTTHQKNYLIKPEGWDITFETNTYDPEKVVKTIDFENREMTFAFLANFLELGQSSGSYALSNDLSDFFLGGIEYIAETISDEFNKIGKELIIMNFGEQKIYPILTAKGITDKAGQEFANMLKTFVDGKLLTPDDRLETNIRNRMGLPDADPDTKREIIPTQIERNIDGKTQTNDQKSNLEITPKPNSDNIENKEELDGESPLEQEAKKASEVKNRQESKKSNKSKTTNKQSSISVRNESNERLSIHGHDNNCCGVRRSGFNSPDEGGRFVRVRRDEKIMLLAEGRAAKQIEDAKIELRKIFKKHLTEIGSALSQKLIKEADKLPESQRDRALNRTQLALPKDFRRDLKASMVNISLAAEKQARSEIPGANNVKLADDFDKLSKKTKRFINSQATLLTQTTARDMEKAVMFQFTSSTVRGADDDLITQQLDETVDTVASGPSVIAAAGNTAGRTVNQARDSFFFNEEVQKSIESFTFTNEDPTAAICVNLVGKTFTKDDPNIGQFAPPLHHNCESYLSVNLAGAKDNPDITPGGLKPTGSKSEVEKAINSITI